MKKITVQRAFDLLMILANGGNPEEASAEEVMLAARMGAVALNGLGAVGTAVVEAAEAAMFYTNQVKQLEGDTPTPRIITETTNGH